MKGNGVESRQFGGELSCEVAANSLQRVAQILSTVHRVFRGIIVLGKRIQRLLNIVLSRVHTQNLLNLLIEHTHEGDYETNSSISFGLQS